MPTTIERNAKKTTPPVAPKRVGGRLSTRGGTAVIATIAGLGALAVLLVFMSNYRDSVRSGANETTVLVADQAIDEGTSGDVVAEAGLFSKKAIPETDAVDGAFTDPSALRGQVATEQVYRGEQLTAASFGPGADPIAGKLEGIQRALSVPVDKAHGNIEQIEAGSRVDVLGGFNAEASGGRTRPVVDVLARDILVLKVPSGSSGDEDTAVVLRVTDVEASRIAFAADSGQLWLTVRPPTLGRDSKTAQIQLENLLGVNATQLGG